MVLTTQPWVYSMKKAKEFHISMIKIKKTGGVFIFKEKIFK
jgi:hypothetical protein